MLPIHKKTGLIDFHDYVRQLEAKHGFELHDMAQIHKQQKQFCRDRGIDHNVWYNKQFTKMNALELEVKELSDAIPYRTSGTGSPTMISMTCSAVQGTRSICRKRGFRRIFRTTSSGSFASFEKN